MGDSRILIMRLRLIMHRFPLRRMTRHPVTVRRRVPLNRPLPPVRGAGVGGSRGGWGFGGGHAEALAAVVVLEV